MTRPYRTTLSSMAGALILGTPAVLATASEFYGPFDVTLHDDIDPAEPTSQQIVWLGPSRLFVSYTANGEHLRVSRSSDGGYSWPSASDIEGAAYGDDAHAYVTYLFSVRKRIHLMTTRPRPYDGFEELPFFTVAAFPTPFRERTTFALPVPDPATAALRVYDVQGRVVRAWPRLQLSRGPNPILWDATTTAGFKASPGVYMWHAHITDSTGEAHDARGRVVLLGH
jgi:hypothetical protein